MLTPRGEGFTPKRALIDKLNDALELVEQIAHPLANKRGNVGSSYTCRYGSQFFSTVCTLF